MNKKIAVSIICIFMTISLFAQQYTEQENIQSKDNTNLQTIEQAKASFLLSVDLSLFGVAPTVGFKKGTFETIVGFPMHLSNDLNFGCGIVAKIGITDSYRNGKIWQNGFGGELFCFPKNYFNLNEYFSNQSDDEEMLILSGAGLYYKGYINFNKNFNLHLSCMLPVVIYTKSSEDQFFYTILSPEGILMGLAGVILSPSIGITYRF